MSDTLSHPPSPSDDRREFESHLLDNIAKKENLSTTTEDDRVEARKELRRLERKRRDKLRTAIEEYRTHPEKNIDEQEEEILESISREIDEQNAREKEKENLVVKKPSALEKELTPLQKMTENFMGPVKGVMKSLIAILPAAWIKKISENNPDGFFAKFANDILREKGVYSKMEEVFGEKNVGRTTDDEKYIKELTVQYEQLPVAEGKKKMSFEDFYTAKIKAASGPSTGPYTLLNVVNAIIDVEAQQDALERESKQKNEQERKRRNLQERMKDIPVKNAVHIYALANAITKISGKDFGIDSAQKEDDLYTRSPDGQFYYLDVSQKISTWLNSTEPHRTLGIELDGDDLEESDDTSWFYDADIIANFKGNLMDFAPAAVESLLNLRVEDLSLNATARRKLPEFQQVLRDELSKITLTQADAPAESSEQL